MSKPLKTVEEILQQLAYKARLSAYSPGYTKLKERPVETAEAKSEIYQLMLSLVGEDEGVVSADDIEDFDVHRLAVERTKIGRNKLRAELRKKLSEHFNGEGEV